MAARLFSAFVLGAACLAGCSVLPPQPLTHSPGFAPVYPVAAAAPEQATGSLYNAGFGETFLGRARNFQVGDVITVVLSESTQASGSNRASSRALPATTCYPLKSWEADSWEPQPGYWVELSKRTAVALPTKRPA